MNLLRDSAHSVLERLPKLASGSDRVHLHELEQAEILYGIPDVLRENAEIADSFLPLRSSVEWKAMLAKLPEFPVGEHADALRVWTTGIPLGEYTLLIPDDASDMPSVQLFAELGGLSGRLILKGDVDNEKFTTRSASVDFTVHCPTVPCGGDAKCKQWCPECWCQSIVLNGFDCSTCWCPFHDDQ